MEQNNFNSNWSVSKRAAFMNSVPPILFGLGISIAPLIAGGKWNEIPRWRLYASLVGMLIPMMVIGAGGLLALIKRIPDWGYTWVGVFMMGIMMAIKTYAEELDDVGRFIISQVGDLVLAGVVFLGVLTVLFIVALRGWQQAGLMSMGMASVLGLTLLQAVSSPPMNRQDISMLSLPLGLLAGFLLYIYAVNKTPVKILSLLGMGIFNVILIWVAHNAWLTWMLSRNRVSPIWPLIVLFSGALLSGPILGCLGIPIRRKYLNS